MKQTGILATCKRCGKTEFFADGCGMAAMTLYNCSGWGSISHNIVCPECWDLYVELRDNMLEKFWGLNKEEQNDI